MSILFCPRPHPGRSAELTPRAHDEGLPRSEGGSSGKGEIGMGKGVLRPWLTVPVTLEVTGTSFTHHVLVAHTSYRVAEWVSVSYTA